MKVKVAVAQVDPLLGDVDGNLVRLCALVTKAADEGAKLVVAPEMATTGYLFKDDVEAGACSDTVPGEATARLGKICAERGIYLVVGILERDGHLLYNTAALLGPEGYISKYRKTHPFLADTRWAVDGDLGFPVWDLPFGRLGVMVCMDVSFFETARLPAVAGADILAFPLNSRQPSPTEQWSVRAAENGFYLMASNRCGFERGTRFTGGSAVVGPDGKVLGALGPDPDVVVVEIDTANTGKDLWGYGKPVADRRPEAYYPLVLSPYTWTPAEVYGLHSAGQPVISLSPAQGNATALRRACEKAWWECVNAKGKPDLLVLPENALQGDGALALDEALNWGKQAAEALGTAIVYGFKEAAGGGLYNSSALATPAGETWVYRQVHVAPGADCGAGKRFVVADLSWGRVGLAIGADLFYPETTRCLSQLGADFVAASMTKQDGIIPAMLRDRGRSDNIVIGVAASTCDFYPPEAGPVRLDSIAAIKLETGPDTKLRQKPYLQKRRPELYKPLIDR